MTRLNAMFLIAARCHCFPGGLASYKPLLAMLRTEDDFKPICMVGNTLKKFLAKYCNRNISYSLKLIWIEIFSHSNSQFLMGRIYTLMIDSVMLVFYN